MEGGDMTEESLTIVLADDHAPTRAGVRLALENAGFAVAAEVGSADAAVEETLRHRPSLCLLDLSMPGGGLSAARRIRDEAPETKIVILTVSPTDGDLFEALVAGASGYLLKDASADRLPAALRAVVEGEVALPRVFERRLIEEFRSRELGPSAPRRGFRFRRHGLGSMLTTREWEVLELIAEHLPTTVVAHRLGISEVTVRRHISSAVHKLGVADREGAVELLSGESHTGWPAGSA
jgi:two-component system, NarL family, nitrate/nitrite response regulator NarL